MKCPVCGYSDEPVLCPKCGVTLLDPKAGVQTAVYDVMPNGELRHVKCPALELPPPSPT